MSARNIENRFPLPNQQQRLKEDKDMRYMKDKFGAIPKDRSLCYICMKQLQVTLFPLEGRITPPLPNPKTFCHRRYPPGWRKVL